MKPPQSELSKLARQYNSLLWQLKGNIGSVKALKYRIPDQGMIFKAPLMSDTNTTRSKLINALTTAADQLEYCEYLIRCLSEAHREAHKYTLKLAAASTQEKENSNE
jgi:hypothetical protein